MLDTPDEAIEKTLEMIEKWQGRGEGRLRPWLGVRHIMSASREFLLKTAEQHKKLNGSLDYRIGIKAHAAVNRDMVEGVMERTGKREIEWLESLGILGPHWLLAHAICLSDNEIELCEKHDVKIVHCPGTSFYCGYGASRGKFVHMLNNGITVSIAPDAPWCNNNPDMFLEMRHVAFLHKEAHMDGSVIPAETALEMATLHGAQAVLWEEEIGSLKPGMKADAIVVDPWRPNSIPLHDHNIVKNLVYATYGNQVETVICNGKLLMEKRQMKTLDEEDIMRRSQELSADIVARHPFKVKSEWPIV
jgi:5-methylthioadenosine/S-adenosylhomocysteine deaminase